MLKNLDYALREFAKYVVQQSRSNLTKSKKNSSKNLYNSIEGKTSTGANSFSLSFIMEDYAMFQDQGVRGAGGTRKTTSQFKRTNNKGKIWKQKGGNSPFSFKEGRKPSVKHFEAWSRKKGLSAYAVREAVFRQGIKPSFFFTKPFERAFKNLPNQVVEAFALDIEDLLDFSTKK
jgi:hypothetical protein